MHFLDQAKIYLKSGGGGPGAVSFRREKYVEYGGPDGGNGGKGGDIIFEAVAGLNTLIDFRYSQHFKALRGTHGMGKDRTGAGAPDLKIAVPVGTDLSKIKDGVPILPRSAKVSFWQGGIGGRGTALQNDNNSDPPSTAGPGEEMGLVRRSARRRRVLGLPTRQVDFINPVSMPGKVGDKPSRRWDKAGSSEAQEPSSSSRHPGLIEGAAEGAGSAIGSSAYRALRV